MLQKCCNQKKTQRKYWTHWTFRPLKSAKIQTKTHEMDVLEALEEETLESHSRRYCFEVFRSCSSVGREASCRGLERAVHIGEVTGSSPVKTTKKRRFCFKLRQNCPLSRHAAKALNHLPQNWGGDFLFRSFRCCEYDL